MKISLFKSNSQLIYSICSHIIGQTPNWFCKSHDNKVISLNDIVFTRRNINTHPWTRNNFLFKNCPNFPLRGHETSFYSTITKFLFLGHEIFQIFLIQFLLLHGHEIYSPFKILQLSTFHLWTWKKATQKKVTGKMPSGKKPPKKCHPEKSHPGKMPPGKMPPRNKLWRVTKIIFPKDK